MRNLRRSAVFTLLVVLLITFSDGGLSAQEQSQPIGQIAYIGVDGNVYLYNFAAAQTTALTEDASEARRYQYPTWSTDSRLAFFCCEPVLGEAPLLETYIWHPEISLPQNIYRAVGEAFTYGYWSPANNCADLTVCRQLGVLVSQTSSPGFKVELIQDRGDGAEDSEHLNIGTGAPFYFSWSPDGSQMVWQRNNRLVDIYQVEKNSLIDRLEVEAGSFAAPMWSPVDDRVLIADRDDETGDLSLLSIEDLTPTVLVEGVDDFVAFNWSPDGRLIAYRTIQRDGYSAVNIIDTATGEGIESGDDNAIAFFWSPDSRKVAYISLIALSQSQNATFDLRQQEGEFALAWAVLSLDDGTTQYFDAFIPTLEMVYILTYFDQFAQSHRFWSSDSRHLVYSETAEDGAAQVMILDTEDTSALPFLIAEGKIGIWSY